MVQNMERHYGGTVQDIEPYMTPNFKDNIIPYPNRATDDEQPPEGTKVCKK